MARDWEALRRAFIEDPKRPKVGEFARKNNVPEKSVYAESSRAGWRVQREEYWEKMEKKAAVEVFGSQVAVTARDMVQKLAQIQAMKQAALKYAAGDTDTPVVYEKPHEAVAAYERLEKLERLVLGESTEIIRVEDAREMVNAIIQVIREEVRDHATTERIASRLAHLGPASRADSNPANLN